VQVLEYKGKVDKAKIINRDLTAIAKFFFGATA
jgi:hypothetical protein